MHEDENERVLDALGLGSTQILDLLGDILPVEGVGQLGP